MKRLNWFATAAPACTRGPSLPILSPELVAVVVPTILAKRVRRLKYSER